MSVAAFELNFHQKTTSTLNCCTTAGTNCDNLLKLINNLLKNPRNCKHINQIHSSIRLGAF